MFAKIIAVSALSMAMATAALAQTSPSPSGDPTGSTKGVASDTDPVGKAVGKEPAMVDPNSTGSTELDARSKMNCPDKHKSSGAAKTVPKESEQACK